VGFVGIFETINFGFGDCSLDLSNCFSGDFFTRNSPMSVSL
jgi:hypothetical protein